jgi:hypothetical protein
VLLPLVESGQYRAIRYTERLAEALNSLFKAECIRNPVMRPKGGWKSVVDVEIAAAEYIDWFNTGACTARSALSHPS